MLTMSDPEALRVEIERLRAEGLRQMESWDAEKRESQRLNAALARYKHLVADLESRVQAAEVERDTQRERADTVEEAVAMLKARVDELIGCLESHGEHKKECQTRSLSSKLMKRELPCTCGFDQMLSGGGAASP